jgi:hypothetical protein
MKPNAAYAVAMLMLLSSIVPMVSAQTTAPSTFGTTVGNSLLCLNQLDELYFRSYFTTAFGAPYKHEGGAYWFKTTATLWGTPITDVLVSDETGPLTFIAAVADVTADKLEATVVAAAGIHHAKLGSPTYSIRQSNPGSQIVYFDKKSKIFCAKSRYLLPN